MSKLVVAVLVVAGSFTSICKSDACVFHTVVREVSPVDTLLLFVPDGYFVPYNMIQGKTGKRENGGIASWDKVWLTNDSLKQTLVLEMYTDGFRNIMFHFFNDDVPAGLIDYMEFSQADGELATPEEKQKNFGAFVSQSTPCSRQSFITNKGFQLGDPKSKAITTYGKPDSVSTNENIERCEWDFVGEKFYNDSIDLKGKPVAKDSFGHEVIMFFRNERLIAIILHNIIP